MEEVAQLGASYFVRILKCWQIKSRRMRWAGHVARMGAESKVYKVLVRKTERKRRLGRPRRGWEDGIRMDLREIDWGSESGSGWLRIGTGGGLL
jgi:hypothetical protein